MKKFFVLLTMLLVCDCAMAEVRDSTAAEAAGTNVASHAIINQLQTSLADANAAVDGDRDAADYINGAWDLTSLDDAKNFILVFFAEKYQMDYMNDLVTKIRQKSDESGREFKYENVKENDTRNIERWWLDRGELDTEKCVWDFARRRACDYPSDYEEFSVMFDEVLTEDDFYWNQTVRVQIDDKDSNKVNIINFSITSQDSRSSGSVMSNVIVRIFGDEYKYDEFYAWQNQMASDIRNGMMRKASLREKRKWKNSPFDVGWVGNDSKNWASMKIPNSVGTQGVFNASFVSQGH